MFKIHVELPLTITRPMRIACVRFDGGAVTSGEAAKNTACQRTMIFRMPPTFVTLADPN